MNPMLVGMGVAGASALISELIASGRRAEADRILAEARDEFGRLDPGKVQALAAEYVGQDPQYDAAMRGSLARVDDQIASGGMTVADRATLDDALDDVARQERAQRAHIMNSMEARGGGGSSQTLLASLVNQQGAAQRAQDAGLQTAGDAQRRYWQAVRDRFGMGAQGAQQQSAVDRWNATQRTDAARFNAGQKQQDFENRYRKASGQLGLAQQQAGRADADAERANAIGAGVGSTAVNAASLYDQDEERRRRAGGGYAG